MAFERSERLKMANDANNDSPVVGQTALRPTAVWSFWKNSEVAKFCIKAANTHTRTSSSFPGRICFDQISARLVIVRALSSLRTG